MVGLPPASSTSYAAQNLGPHHQAFVGCVSDLDLLERALDFNTEVIQLQNTPTAFRGDVFRYVVCFMNKLIV